uniref:ABC transmembrane type-1 domain-containing protein n=1 Tax=Rhabditophanes sp. KR3021 TaxID=114890 RepID=A0AC35U495_9BILA
MPGIRKTPMTKAERQKAYRQRQKDAVERAKTNMDNLHSSMILMQHEIARIKECERKRNSRKLQRLKNSVDDGKEIKAIIIKAPYTMNDFKSALMDANCSGYDAVASQYISSIISGEPASKKCMPSIVPSQSPSCSKILPKPLSEGERKRRQRERQALEHAKLHPELTESKLVIAKDIEAKRIKYIQLRSARLRRKLEDDPTIVFPEIKESDATTVIPEMTESDLLRKIESIFLKRPCPAEKSDTTTVVPDNIESDTTIAIPDNIETDVLKNIQPNIPIPSSSAEKADRTVVIPANMLTAETNQPNVPGSPSLAQGLDNRIVIPENIQSRMPKCFRLTILRPVRRVPQLDLTTGISEKRVSAMPKQNVVASIEKICPILVRPISRHHESELLINEEDEEEIKMSSYETGKKLINYCRHYSYWFAGSFTCSVIFAGTLVSVPFFTGKLIAELVNGGGVEVIIKSVCFVGGLSLVSSFFGGLVWGSAEWASALIHQKMRMDLLKSLIYQDAAFYDELQTGEITSRLSSDVEKMASLMATNFNVSLRVSLMLSGSFIYMFLLSWRLCIVCFIMIPLYAIVTSRFGNMFDKVGEKDQDTMANSNKKAEEILSAMKTVKSFASEGRELGKYEQLLKKNLVVKRTKAYLEISYGWFAELCENTILVLVLAYGGYICMTKRMSAEDLIKFLLYQSQINRHLMDMAWVYSNIMDAVGSSRKVFEYIERVSRIPKTGTDKSHIEGKVTFKNVNFSYPSRPNQIVLNNLTIEADVGTIVALVGPSGAGKSSIISLIKRFYLPSDGEILIDGKNINTFDNDYYHKKIVLVSQNPVLFAGTIRENILYGSENGTDEEMIKAAKLANCHEFIMETELGYDSICGEKGCLFSGGQIQRLCIARVLVLQCKIILLDESTSSLDSTSEALVQDAIYKNLKDKTVFVIAHRLSTIEKANKIYVINQGQVEQVGDHQELMEDSKGMYYSLVQKQKLANKQPTDLIEFDDLIENEEHTQPSTPVIFKKPIDSASPC